VNLKAVLNASGPGLMLDGGRVTQVLLNLISNAIQAFKPGGEVRVQTKNHNGAVFLQVSDNGCGIGAEDSVNIFEPFFSTRRRGRVWAWLCRKRLLTRMQAKSASTRIPLGEPSSGLALTIEDVKLAIEFLLGMNAKRNQNGHT